MNLKKIFSKSSGFTLIELLAVVAVITVLAGTLMVLINPFGQFQRTRDGQRKSDLAQLQRAMEQYYNDFGEYPPKTNTYNITDRNNNDLSWGKNWNPYLSVIPKDPSSAYKYIYSPASDKQSYRIYAHLEKTTDSQACNQNNQDCANVPAANLCGTSISCNYGVSSSNVSP